MSVFEKKPRHATRLVAAGPGALTAVLLVGAVAFGASTLRGPSSEPASPVATDEPRPSVVMTAERKDGPAHPVEADPKTTARPKPSEKPTDKPKDDAKEEAKDDVLGSGQCPGLAAACFSLHPASSSASRRASNHRPARPASS